MIWPAFVLPKDDELLSSWVRRNAYSHGIDLQFLLSSIWSQKKIGDIDLYIDNQVYNLLAKKLSTPKRQVLRTFIGNPKSPYKKWVCSAVLAKKVDHRYSLMVCPICLKGDGEDAHYRKNWRMAFTFLCTRCRCQLLDACPVCCAPLSIFNPKTISKSSRLVLPLNVCPNCQFDLCQSQTIFHKSDMIDIQHRINHSVSSETRMNNNLYSNEEIYSLCQSFSSCRQYFEELASAVSKELKIPHHPVKWKESKGFSSLRICQRKYYLTVADWLLTNDKVGKLDYIIRYYGVKQ